MINLNEQALTNDFHFSMPNSAPTLFPVNTHARFSPPQLPNEFRGVAKTQPTPRLPQGTFYNSSNPGRLKLPLR